MRVIYLFGNQVYEPDAVGPRLYGLLQKRLPEVKFELRDPTESLSPPENCWMLIDAAIGIDEVTVVQSLDELEYVSGTSVHDFDVYLELRLLEKLNRLGSVTIVLVPANSTAENVIDDVVALVRQFLAA